MLLLKCRYYAIIYLPYPQNCPNLGTKLSQSGDRDISPRQQGHSFVTSFDLSYSLQIILFGIACTYRVAVLLRRGLTPRALLITGMVVGVGTLTKLSVLVFVPVAGMVVLLQHWPDWKTIIRQGFLLAVPVALIGGPWYR